MNVKRRILNILIAFDQLIWVLISLGAGHPDETISSAMYRYEKKGLKIGLIMRPCIDRIFMLLFKDKNHCRKAYLSEKFRRQNFIR